MTAWRRARPSELHPAWTVPAAATPGVETRRDLSGKGEADQRVRTLPTALIHAVVAARVIPGVTLATLSEYAFQVQEGRTVATAPDGTVTLQAHVGVSARRRDGPPVLATVNYATPGGVNVTLSAGMSAPSQTPAGVLSIPELLRAFHNVPVGTFREDDEVLYIRESGEILPMTVTAVSSHPGCEDMEPEVYGITASGRQLILRLGDWGALVRPEGVPVTPWNARRSPEQLRGDLRSALQSAHLDAVTYVRAGADRPVQILTGPTAMDVTHLLRVRTDELPLLSEVQPGTFHLEADPAPRPFVTPLTLAPDVQRDLRSLREWYDQSGPDVQAALCEQVQEVGALRTAGRLGCARLTRALPGGGPGGRAPGVRHATGDHVRPRQVTRGFVLNNMNL
ncbi:hypothetical protein [Deinococcus sp.]|uniref:hypothetical protein n=1 Tax=Deinococcus sp. TaxID=47478 RepID=UPI0025C52FD1|nr:hypothetical protein [Deinococcus sp.]